MILLLCRDLLFVSKVTGTAGALGIPTATCLSVEQLQTAAAADDVRGVILDLSSGVAPADVTAALPSGRAILRVAFGPHVDVTALEAARSAGFEAVLPRSRFSAELPQLLRQLEQGPQ